MKVTVLGTEYKVELCDSREVKNADGLCNQYAKTIKLVDPNQLFDGTETEQIRFERFREVIIHELVHAFSKESGTEYDDDEALVDWIAFMFPKISKAYNTVLEELQKGR